MAPLAQRFLSLEYQSSLFAFLLCSLVRNNKMLAESTLHGARRRRRRRRAPSKDKEMYRFGIRQPERKNNEKGGSKGYDAVKIEQRVV